MELRRWGLMLAVLSTLGTSACVGDAPEGRQTPKLRVVYQRTDAFTALDELLREARDQYERDHDVSVELLPVEAADDEYATRLGLMQRSARTAPDVFYEDSFRLRADAEAGYLLPLDSFLENWPDWDNFLAGAKGAGRGEDGRTYAVPLGTDTRGIWYSRSILAKAGVKLPWRPRDWQDILDAAEKIRKTQPGVIPFNVYAGTASGEGSVMQGFAMLLYGTGDVLYDDNTRRWVAGSRGFEDSLRFLQDLYGRGLGPDPSAALQVNVWQTLYREWFPQGKLGGTIEGSWSPSFWQKGGTYQWPGYDKEIDVAPFPTQFGQPPGRVSLSGGWTMAVGARSSMPREAFEFISTVSNRENSLRYAVSNAQITVRRDVAQEPAYRAANPYIDFSTSLVEVSRYRPATTEYPRISAEIQEATEAVITGERTPQQAAEAYDRALEQIVGPDKILRK